MARLVIDQAAQQILGHGAIADQVVVDEEDVGGADGAQGVELAFDLRHRLGPGLASEHHDDVAELAEVGAAAGELHRRRRVAIELQQVEARRRRVGERDDAGLPVHRAGAAVLEMRAEPRPGVLGFTRDDGVGERDVALGAQRGEAAACDDRIFPVAVVAEQLALPLELHAHPAHADQVDVGRQRHRFDVLVDDLHVPRRGAERGERGEPKRRVDRALGRQDAVDRPFEAPEALGIFRVDQQESHAVGRPAGRARRIWGRVESHDARPAVPRSP